MKSPSYFPCHNSYLLWLLIVITIPITTVFSILQKLPSESAINTRQFKFPTDDQETIIIEPPSQAQRVTTLPALSNASFPVPSAPAAFPIPNTPTATLSEEELLLAADIQHLDEILQAEMRQKKPRPIINPGTGSVTINLLPKPNFSFLPDLSPLRQLFEWSSDSVRSHTTCYACKVGFGLFLTKARLKTTLEDVMKQATFACGFFQIASEEVCQGLIERFTPTLYYIGTSKSDLTPITFCAMVLQSAAGCVTKDPTVNWNILEGQHLLGKFPSTAAAVTGIGFNSRFRSPAAVQFYEAELPVSAKIKLLV